MPERTGAHCLYDRFAAAVRRQITIAISGSLRKKPATTASPRSPRNQRPSRPRSGYRNRNFAGSGVRVGGAGGVRLLAALMRINYRSARRM